MFNGIIHNTGSVVALHKNKNSAELILKTKMSFGKSDIGSSLCCNGACLTLTKIKKNLIFFYLSKETLDRTSFRFTKLGDHINLEKSLRFGNKISGHYVQGHIDTTANILNIKIVDKTWLLSIQIRKSFYKYLISKGSIAINGVSLTISKIKKNGFEINIIPHTLKLTNLINLKKNNYVNIEFDIFSKYLFNLKK